MRATTATGRITVGRGAPACASLRYRADTQVGPYMNDNHGNRTRGKYDCGQHKNRTN
jgi:hypothetical protein